MASTVRVLVAAPKDPLIDKAVEILSREVTRRTRLTVQRVGRAPAEMTLAVRGGIGEEGYAIENGPGGGPAVVGNDPRGVLYGVGELLRTSRYAPGAFEPTSWRGTSMPKRKVRGIYFASHFHNFYHDAPVNEVQRYVEELALWGCNTLAVWFDMHHFRSIDDPAARAMIDRLRAVLQAAVGAGIRPALTTLSNEAYCTSPEELRADWTAGHDGYTTPPGGHYHVEICPSKPGGLELILRWRREMLHAFADLDIGYVWLWPYDQGGCTCSRCAPWGANGFLRCSKAYAELVRSMLPQAKTILSTWYFDHFTTGEWEGLDRYAKGKATDWFDYVMADDYGDTFPPYPLAHGVPGGKPMVCFPEISMYKNWPWGGYGANPTPLHIQSLWKTACHALDGGFPYSEGIFEDLNKVVCLQNFWGDRDAMETVRRYAAYECSPEVADEVASVAAGMEQEMEFYPALNAAGEELRKKIYPPAGQTPAKIFNIVKPLTGSPGRLARMNAVESKLPAWARAGWRWRILHLRAKIDAEMHRTGGVPTEALDGFFEELCGIYHAQHALFHVSPPSRRAIVRCHVDSRPEQT